MATGLRSQSLDVNQRTCNIRNMNANKLNILLWNTKGNTPNIFSRIANHEELEARRLQNLSKFKMSATAPSPNLDRIKATDISGCGITGSFEP
jgi:hypothetical protein